MANSQGHGTHLSCKLQCWLWFYRLSGQRPALSWPAVPPGALGFCNLSLYSCVHVHSPQLGPIHCVLAQKFTADGPKLMFTALGRQQQRTELFFILRGCGFGIVQLSPVVLYLLASSSGGGKTCVNLVAIMGAANR